MPGDGGSPSPSHPTSSPLPVLSVSMLPQSSKVALTLPSSNPLESTGLENPFPESGNASFTGMVSLSDPVMMNGVSNMDHSSHLLSVEEIGHHSNSSLVSSVIPSSPSHVSHSVMPISDHLLSKDMSDLRSLTTEAAHLDLISGIHHLANEMVEAQEKNNNCVVEMMPEVTLGATGLRPLLSTSSASDFIGSNSNLNLANESEVPPLSEHSQKLTNVHDLAALTSDSLPQRGCSPSLGTISPNVPKIECQLPSNGRQQSVIMPSFALHPSDSVTMSSVTAAGVYSSVHV